MKRNSRKKVQTDVSSEQMVLTLTATVYTADFSDTLNFD